MNWTEIIVVIIAAIVAPIVVPVTRRLVVDTLSGQKQALTYGKEVAVRACDGKYVMASLYNHNMLFARERHIQTWEIFKLVHASSPFSHVPKRTVRYGDKVAFLAMNNNNFVGAALDRECELAAWVAHVKEYEIFILLRPPNSGSKGLGRALRYGSFFALRAYNGQNVMYNRDGDGRLLATAPHVSDWETFVFIDPAHPQ